VNQRQIEHWNSTESRRWVDQQAAYDRQLEPFGDLVFEAAALTAADTVLDIGCGCGTTTLRAAQASRLSIGVDVSAPMLARAREEAAARGVTNAEFLEVDAQSHPFTAESVDVAISRFGVMFFDDPTTAFANIRAALRPGARLAFVCWQDFECNDWLRVPLGAAGEFLPMPAPPDGPGPWSLSDPRRVETVLTAAGFADIGIEPHSVTMLVGGTPSVDDACDFVLRSGFGIAMFDGADPDVAERARAAVRDVMAQHADDTGVHLGTGSWVVTARPGD
jgi:SAM-dependent methyltransferase